MTSNMRILSDCSMRITPTVINMLTGLEQESTKIGEMELQNDSSINSLNESVVRISYTKGLTGECYLVIGNDTRDKIVAAMFGITTLEGLNVPIEILDSAVCELMNQIAGSIISSVSELAKTSYDISCPELVTKDKINIEKGRRLLLNIFYNAKDNITVKLINSIA